MKHKYKTILFKILDSLPNKLGSYFYHKIQNYADVTSLEKKISLSESTYNQYSSILNKLNQNIEGKSILEIGSGWYPILPYFFKFRGKAKFINTYDINEHYQKKAIIKFNSLFAKIYNFEIIINANNSFGLPSEIFYYPSTNIINTEIHNIDLVFSRYVLSHMTQEDIVEMHKAFKQKLRKGTLITHFISPSDLRQHGDKSLSLQDFLIYSKEEWDKIYTRFNYHNRLRLPEFIAIFKSLYIEIIYQSYESLEKGTEKHDLFKKLDLHDDYKNFTEDELTAGNLIFVLKI